MDDLRLIMIGPMYVCLYVCMYVVKYYKVTVSKHYY